MAQPPDGNAAGFSMIWWGRRNPPAEPTARFTGKTVLVTGANTGLGLEAAVKFAALGASRLILGVRSIEKGKSARAEICKRTGFQAAKIEVLPLDMCSFQSAIEFVGQINHQVSRLDIAILNAGVAAASYKKSPEGYEETLQVNLLSTALLAILLLPKMRQTASSTEQASHLEFVSSVSHHTIKPGDLDPDHSGKLIEMTSHESYFDIQRQYAITKLLLMYVVDGMVADTTTDADSNTQVIINTVCPGLCRSNLGRDFSPLLKVPAGWFQSVFARSAEEGSRSIVSGVSLGPEAHGEFWSHDTFFRKGKMLTSPEGKKTQVGIWNEVKNILEEKVSDLDRYLRGET